jgi:alkylhydroperoxidase/carboxymuconolactone decarboxylase family protein YurZ
MTQEKVSSQIPMEPDLGQILFLVRISARLGLREEEALKTELQAALQQKIPLLLIRETILQAYLFAGYAATINAFHLLNELVPDDSAFLLEEDGSLELWKERGNQLCRQIYGDQFEKLLKNMNRLHPDLADWMIWEGYGKVLSRPFLSPRVRELLIVGMTAALQVERQFHSHVRGSLHVGATPTELRRVLKAVNAEPRFHTILENFLV